MSLQIIFLGYWLGRKMMVGGDDVPSLTEVPPSGRGVVIFLFFHPTQSNWSWRAVHFPVLLQYDVRNVLLISIWKYWYGSFNVPFPYSWHTYALACKGVGEDFAALILLQEWGSSSVLELRIKNWLIKFPCSIVPGSNSLEPGASSTPPVSTSAVYIGLCMYSTKACGIRQIVLLLCHLSFQFSSVFLRDSF